MEIIVPAAGLSSRFPRTKPKYLLYCYDNQMMIKKALEPWLDAGHNITIGILHHHNQEFSSIDFLKHEFGSRVQIVVLDTLTRGPADTVYKIIKQSNIDPSAQLLIKDCDSFFKFDNSVSGNFICTSNIADHQILKKLNSKSFVIKNEQNIITEIIEKKVVSDTFCVGGYGFESVQKYVETFENIESTPNEIYVSDVISKLLNDREIFLNVGVNDYTDVGTLDDWNEYNDKPVIFCDIDGTIIKAQGRVGNNNFYSPVVLMEQTVQKLLEMQKNGSQFVFTTARPKELERQTHNILTTLGFKNYQLVIGLNNSRRILINDFNGANPYPRATAINVERDGDEAWKYL